MSSLPPMALEVTPDGIVFPVEAPPCGERLDIPERGVHLVCDRPAGHTDPGDSSVMATRHRHIIRLSPPHAVAWCNDHCAQPCEPLAGVLDLLKQQGLSIHQTREGRQ